MNPICSVFGIVIIIIVGGLAISMITPDTTDPTGQWSYDDYRPADGATGASGALELVTAADGSVLIHARDVGRGIIEFPDRVLNVTVAPAKLDVYLITGQSNSTHSSYDDLSLAEPLPRPGTAYAWMTEDGQFGTFTAGLEPAMRPMVSVDGVAMTGNKAPAFAATANEITGNKTYWICGGLPGVSVGYFDPNGSAGWNYMKGVVSNAMNAIDSKLFEVHTICYMWVQGETDADMSVERYKEIFLRIHDAMLGGRLGWDFGHCFISLITSQHGGNARQAQLDLAQEYPETITIATEVADTFTIDNGLMGADGLHYTQMGNNIIGADLGRACGEYAAKIADTATVNTSMLKLIPSILAVMIPILALRLIIPLVIGRD